MPTVDTPVDPPDLQAWLVEFDTAANRPLRTRVRYALILKDRESVPRLKSFRECWLRTRS